MNSFEIDLGRAVFSIRFLAGLILQVVILYAAGYKSDLYYISVPVLCTFPYSTAWLCDYQSGYIKPYIQRSGVSSYIIGKILSCGISGGLLETAGCFIFYIIKKEEGLKGGWLLIFMSGMLWSVFAAMLAAISQSRYIAFGGSFVIYYILVMMHERYFKKLYCLYPYEWLSPEHTWVFGEQGVVILTMLLTVILIFIYYEVLRRCIENV